MTLERLARWRVPLALAFSVVLSGALVAAVLPASQAIVRPKLAFAGFAAFYLFSPVITLGRAVPPTFDPNDAIFWTGGWAALAAVAVLLVVVWQRGTGAAGRSSNATVAFILVFIGASLLPVSSMTEGKRYLYLASIGGALLIAHAVGRLRSAPRVVALATAAAILALSVWQLQLKARDWAWAGEMTQETVRTVRAGTPDPCRARDVLLLTAPVNIRDVYCNFYDYTFEDPRTRCLPQAVRAVVRVVGRDVETTATWMGPRTIVFTTKGRPDRLVTSADMRHFDVPLASPAILRLALPVGRLHVAPGDGGTRFDLQLADDAQPERWQILYYGSGRVRELAPLVSTGR